jgi:LysM repeat protein
MGAVGVGGDTSTDGVYTVKSGDSLGEIAQRNHTTTEQLKKLNQLKSDRIFVGQKIKLP